MAAIDFPSNPSPNDVFTAGDRSWKWNGTVWQTVTSVIGAQGDKGGLRYAFDPATTISQPEAGYLRFNSATPASVTSIAINSETTDGVDVSNFFVTLGTSLPDELSVIKYYLVMQGNVNGSPTNFIFAVDTITDNGTWIQLSGEYLAGVIPSESEDLIISLSRVGDLGPTGPETSITIGTVETSLPGATGAVSISGPPGSQVLSFTLAMGPTGPETSISLGTVVTSLPGGTGAVAITGPAGNQVLSFTIPQGPTGPETSISIGTVSTNLPGSTAAASITGPPGNQVLSLTIPQGPTGPNTSISVGTVNTGLPGTTAGASVTGPPGSQVLSLTIPQGPTGPETSISIGTVSTGLPASSASASVTGPPGNQVISFTIPQGPTGPETSITIGTVETSLPGATGAVSISGPPGSQVLSFTLAMGPTGPETSISLGTIDTSLPGGTGAASITGPAGNQVLSLTIPQGPTGPGGVYQYNVTGPTAPTTINGETVANGDTWFNSETGRFYIYYDGYWVENTSSLAGPAGLGYDGITSASSNSIPTTASSRTFVLNTVGALTEGSFVTFFASSDVTKWMQGQLTSINYSTRNVVISVTEWNGTGTFSDWNVSLNGRVGPTGPKGDTGNTGPSGDPTLTVTGPTISANAYTIQAADISKLLNLNNGATAMTLFIPVETNTFPIGTQINIVQVGTGQVTIQAATPGTTTVNATPGLKLRAQWSGATLVKRAANTWWVTGDLAA